MNPLKVSRDNLNLLTDLPNIGKAGAEDLVTLGVTHANDLIGRCPYEMHAALCGKTGIRHDLCVIDVFISLSRFMAGYEAKLRWHYTRVRKASLALQG